MELQSLQLDLNACQSHFKKLQNSVCDKIHSLY